MIKLNFPKICDDEILTVCADHMKTSNCLKIKLVNSKEQLLESYEEYEDLAAKLNLYLLPTNDSKESESQLIGELSHKDLTKLYTEYFVRSNRKCRKYYEEILNITNNCPYCSGIGETRTLDHYLIKSQFPQYSILSKNLIPCCADCNSPSVGKGQSIARSIEEQPIHPYFDKNIFFNETWVCAEYQKDANYFLYNPCPPEHWNEIDKKRAVNHFESFNLNTRFSRFANNELPTVLDQIKMIRNEGVTIQDMIKVILEPWTSDNLGLNHWKRLMYIALVQHYHTKISS